MKWIKANERLPGENRFKPIYCKEGEQRYMCKYHDGLFYNVETAFADYPSHWLDEAESHNKHTDAEIMDAFYEWYNKTNHGTGTTFEKVWITAIQWLRTSGVREGTEKELREVLRELVEQWNDKSNLTDPQQWGIDMEHLMVKAAKLLSKTI